MLKIVRYNIRTYELPLKVGTKDFKRFASKVVGLGQMRCARNVIFHRFSPFAQFLTFSGPKRLSLRYYYCM